MAPKTAIDEDEIREELKTTKGADRSDFDLGDDEHPLADMDSGRNAPIEVVAKNSVDKYDERRAAYREYLSNAQTACIRRAKYELRDAGITDLDFDDVNEVLERAKEDVGYEPCIVVKRNEDPNDYSLIVEDNGIGITSRTAYALRDPGLSGWKDDAKTNGQFGVGTMSGFLFVDHYGEFRMDTKSRISDEQYGARWTLTDLDDLPGKRDTYGTTFTFPYFCEEAQEIDDYEAVREYTEAFVVPVIYEHYDEDGMQNGEKSDDFTPTYIEDRYSDDSPIVSYEDEYVKAVWSPDDPEGWNTNIGTWCGWQPIDRNGSGFSINTYEMPSAFDLRLKVEDGSIVDCDDESLNGLIPVSQGRYDRLDGDEKEGCVPRSDVPPDTIVAPEPTQDRDRFESKNVDDFCRYISGKLAEQFKSEVGAIIEDLDGLEDLPDLSRRDRSLLLEGIDEYLSVYKKNDADRVQDDIEEEFGVRPDSVFASNIRVVKSQFGDSVSDDFAEAVGQMKQTRLGSVDDEDSFADTVSEMTREVSLAPRDKNASCVGRAKNRSDMEVWEIVLDMDDDADVFMAKTLNCSRKVALSWELHEDNEVVQVDDYGRWENVFGWKKLKDLPSRNFDDKVDEDLDDDFVDEWDPALNEDSSSTDSSEDLSGLGFDEERAKQRTIKVRTGTGYGQYSNYSGEHVHDAFDDGDETVRCNYETIDTLIVYDQTEGHSASVGEQYASPERGIAYAVVPQYVYEYLSLADDVVTEDEYVRQQKQQWIEFDWTRNGFRQGAEVAGLDERDVIVRNDDGLREGIEQYDAMDDLVDAVDETLESWAGIDDVRSITFFEPGEIEDYYEVLSDKGCIDHSCAHDERPTLCNVDSSGYGKATFGYSYTVQATIDAEDAFFDSVLPELDRSTTEWHHFNPKMDDEDLIDALQDLQDSGGFVSTDDHSVPDWVGDDDVQVSENDYWISQTMERFEEHTDYFSEPDGEEKASDSAGSSEYFDQDDESDDGGDDE